MKFTQLISKVFYEDLSVGIELFVDCLGFEITYDHVQPGEERFCVIARDGFKLMLVESPEYAAKDRPEIRLETDDIEEVFHEVSTRYEKLLHPNLPRPTLRPWGAIEFALVDRSFVCIVVCEWVNRT